MKTGSAIVIGGTALLQLSRLAAVQAVSCQDTDGSNTVYDCGSNTLRSSDVTCSQATCTSEECCYESCGSYTGNCTVSTEGPASDTQPCWGASDGLCTEGICCVDDASCVSDFAETDCFNGTMYNSTFACDGDCDVEECCVVDTCDSYTCNSDSGMMDIDNAEYIACELNSAGDAYECTEDLCCVSDVDGEDDECDAEATICQNDADCGVCLAALFGDDIPAGCTMPTEDTGDCAEIADFACCVLSDACDTDALMMDMLECMAGAAGGTCTFTDVCNYDGEGDTPSSAPSHFGRSALGAAIAGSIAVSLAGLLASAGGVFAL